MFFRKIIKSTIALILYKYYSVKKCLKIIISCICTEYLYNVILRSAKKIEYESTIIGITVTCFSYIDKKYGYLISRIITYTFFVLPGILGIIIPVLPSAVIEFFEVDEHNIFTLIYTLIVLSYNLIYDFIMLFCK